MHRVYKAISHQTSYSSISAHKKMYYMVEHTKVENQISKIVSLLVIEFNIGHILNLCICVTTFSMFYSSITTQEQIFMREISEECGAVIL